MKRNKEKKQPLGTFIYPSSNLTTYVPNQIQTYGLRFWAGEKLPALVSLLLTNPNGRRQQISNCKIFELAN
jgi:hypothetical protein